jgi:hypothetical protein
MKIRVCILVVVVLFSISCSSGRSSTAGTELRGQVVDPNNNPVPGVQVVAGTRRVATDATGRFRLQGLAPVPRFAVSFSAAGFVNTTRVFAAGAGCCGTTVVIWPRSAAVTISGATGGTVPFANGGSLVLPPNGLVDTRQQAISGPVDVSVTYFDVSNPEALNAVPGDFSARMRDGSTRRLQSFGIVEIAAAERGSGSRVDLARGTTAELRMPIPAAFVRRARDRVGSYSFEPATGLWVEEGTLTLQGLVYSGTIDRFDWSWNADDPLDTTCMTFKVLQPGSNQPHANALVKATGVGYGTISSGYTDAQGLVCLLVKRNDQISLQAYSSTIVTWQSPPLVVTTPNIASGAADCGDPQLCPLTTIVLDVITGGGHRIP